MALPVFYSADITDQDDEHELNEETSRHIVQVLRMKKDERLNVTNGNGYMFLTSIVDDHKKKVIVRIIERIFQQRPPNISVGISLVKNVQRFEWFLEKAVEIGVAEIFPLICARTEKQQFRTSRMQGIVVSAMLQSQQAWRPTLHEPVKLPWLLDQPLTGNAFIAHCVSGEVRATLPEFAPLKNPMILIGPEGDFTNEEIEKALQNNYKPVSLGSTRLRTETAGIVAVTLLKNFNVHLPD